MSFNAINPPGIRLKFLTALGRVGIFLDLQLNIIGSVKIFNPFIYSTL
jgi:hypothetical protein